MMVEFYWLGKKNGLSKIFSTLIEVESIRLARMKANG